jgi:hypothetical protein
MTSLDNFKTLLLEAEKAAGIPLDEYHAMARKLVNIERQSFYGEESPMKRLNRIREEINTAIKKGDENEI